MFAVINVHKSRSSLGTVQAATLLMPAGLIAAFRPLTHASLFLVLYGVTAIYFSGVMVRATF